MLGTEGGIRGTPLSARPLQEVERDESQELPSNDQLPQTRGRHC